MAGPGPAPVYTAAPPRSPPPRYAPPQQPAYAPPPQQQAYAPPQQQPVYTPPPPPAYVPPEPTANCIDPGPRDISDRFDQAAVVNPTSTTVGCISPNDMDTFVVTAPPGGAGSIIHYSLRGQSKMSPTIAVFDANRGELHRVNGNASAEAKGWVHVAGGTPVFFRVSQWHQGTDSYFLTLTAEPLRDPGEPNNDMDHATPLHEGRPATGFASNAANDPTSFDDWYRIDVAHDGALKLDLDMSEGASPQLTIFDANRREMERVSGGVSERIQKTTRVHHGTYFIKLRPWHGLASAGNGDLPPWLVRPYTLTATQ